MVAPLRAQDAPEVAEASGAAADAGEFAGSRIRVAFAGELLDESNRPLSGVFPLRFSLYRSAASEAPVWSELQHVAVFEGAYEVTLGRVERMPAAWEGERRVLEIAVDGAGVIASQTIALVPWVPEQDLPGPTIRHERYVDLAGTAIAADQAAVAENCRTLGGTPAATLDRYEELQDRLDEVRARIDRPSANRIGSESVTIGNIGGTSGVPYERNCPPGYVMTGARGGSGQLIDGIRIICTIVE
jgi:hypothetical protein